MYNLADITYSWNKLGLTGNARLSKQLSGFDHEIIRSNTTVCEDPTLFPRKLKINYD